MYSWATLVSRIFLSAIFIWAGLGKIMAYAGTEGYMEHMGVPSVLLPFVILTEVGAGLAVLLGFQTRIAAFLLAGFSILSAFIFHLNFADQMQSIMFMKNIAIAGGLLSLFANGAGIFAVDNLSVNNAVK